MASLPPRSLAPALPPRAAAETRVAALKADLAVTGNLRVRAALSFELGALAEMRLGDRDAARRCYEAAAEAAPDFRPPLFALARMLREDGDDRTLAALLEATVRASANDAEAASLLVSLGTLREDALGDEPGARECYEQALARDPGCRAALVMLERMARAAHDEQDSAARSKQRAAHTRDATLRAVLLCEVAEREQSEGAVDEAVASLLGASEAPGLRFVVLLRLLRLSRAEGRLTAAAQALHDLADVLGDALEAGRRAEAAQMASALLPGAAPSAVCTWLLREAGRLHFEALDEPERAAQAYQAAGARLPDDALILLERLSVAERRDDLETARVQTWKLLELARDNPARGAALRFRLAELAARAGDGAGTRRELEAALSLEPGSPAALAVLQDLLLDGQALASLGDHLEAEAARLEGQGRNATLLHAAALLSARGGDPARALSLYRRLSELGADEPLVLREAYGVALRANDPSAQLWAARALLRHDLDEAETDTLLRKCYEAELELGNVEAAAAALRAALDHPACNHWAPHVAAVTSALRGDLRSLAEAHARLAEQSDEAELTAAHLCAQARALWRLGEADAALDGLTRALSLAPAHDYAVALIEEILLARGDATDAVHVLREAAASARTAQASELSLLHAGAAAELSGRVDLAAESYEELLDREPTSLPALWSLRRLGERSRDPRTLLSALSGLAQRESQLERAGFANLELAERYDAIGKPELALTPLLAARDGALPFEASVAAWLLAESPTSELSPAGALAVLRGQVRGEDRAFIDREQVALAMRSSPEQARALSRELGGERAQTAEDALAWLLLSRDAEERVQALSLLADGCEAATTRAELRLHAQRVSRAVLARAEDDLLLEAIQAADQDPDTLQSAVGLADALSPSDDPELRARAALGRLPYASVASGHGLSLGLSRALFDAGHGADALALARKLVTEQPRDLCAFEVLRAAAHAERAFEDVVLACDTLAHAARGEARAMLLEEAAGVLEDELARPADAEVRLRAALEADPRRLTAFERLHDLLVSRHDLEGLTELLSARVGVASSGEERLDLLYEQARVLRALGERSAALACAEEVLAGAPHHPGALGLVAEIFAAEQEWAQAVETLRTLAQADVPDAQQKLARQGAAEFLEHKLGDLAGAYRELAELERAGLADLGVYKRMAELAQRAQLWNEAVGALEHAAALSEGVERAAFSRRAGAILARDNTHRPAARKAYERALQALPTDIDACEALCALLDAPEQDALLAGFTTTLLSLLSRAPADASLLRSLVRAARAAHDATLEHVASSTLVALELATPEETEAQARLAATVPGRPSDVLGPEQLAVLGDARVPDAAWRFARITCKAWLDAQADSPAQHGVTKHERLGKTARSAARDALEAWTACFGLRVAEVYVGGSAAGRLTMVQTPGHEQDWIVGRGIESLDARTRFRVAEQCMAMRMQVAPLVLLDRTFASDLLRAASALTGRQAPEALRGLCDTLASKLSRAQRRELAAAYAELPDGAAALEALIRSARLGALRAGLLASSDLRTALGFVLGERVDPALVAGSDVAMQLLRFWTSSALIAMRRELGLSP